MPRKEAKHEQGLSVEILTHSKRYCREREGLPNIGRKFIVISRFKMELFQIKPTVRQNIVK